MIGGKYRYGKPSEKEVIQWDASALRLNEMLKLSGVKASDIHNISEIAGNTIYESNFSDYRHGIRGIKTEHLDIIAGALFEALTKKGYSFDYNLFKNYLSGLDPTSESYEEYEASARCDLRLNNEKYQSFFKHANFINSFSDEEYGIYFNGTHKHLSPAAMEAYYQENIKSIQSSFELLTDDNSNDSFWYATATEKERELAMKVGSFLPLFDDMLFRPGSITDAYTACTINGNDEVMHLTLPDQIEYFDIESYKFKITDLGSGTLGKFDPHSLTIYVCPDQLKNDSTILHEMIHLYEHVINELPICYHDILCIALYKDLSSKITDLDSMITTHGNILNQYDINETGGIHDILFYLKSLSLDISMNYPLNTVMGYGYKEEGDAHD